MYTGHLQFVLPVLVRASHMTSSALYSHRKHRLLTSWTDIISCSGYLLFFIDMLVWEQSCIVCRCHVGHICNRQDSVFLRWTAYIVLSFTAARKHLNMWKDVCSEHMHDGPCVPRPTDKYDCFSQGCHLSLMWLNLTGYGLSSSLDLCILLPCL